MPYSPQRPYRRLRLVLGDQLNAQHPWWAKVEADTLYVMMEVRSETDYARHHIQKIVAFFLAMRHFAAERAAEGHHVCYIPLDAPDNAQHIVQNLGRLARQHGAQSLGYQQPDEYRLDQMLSSLGETLGLPVEVADTAHFLSPREGVARLFAGKKQYLMETFYRKIRQQYGILMEADGKTPLTGRWNYDAENRKKLPAALPIPPAKDFPKNVAAIVAMLERHGVASIGRIRPEAFVWPVTRAEALDLLEHFAQHLLPFFGHYQDALSERDYALFHSRLSFALNSKLIGPLEVVQRCVAEWERRPALIGIAQIEGFVRQIIGWREYMRGIYWAEMPSFAQRNYFEHQAPLPAWYWTGETNMRCLRAAIGQSLDHAYAHHIQRLMVTGAFALLLGVHPDAVDAWYLGIYIDAIEWVEITNTRGMSQFADGGIVGTKPYVGSANYMHKMGEHCDKCHYDRKAKHGPRACPFNSLYWDFYQRHADKLARNPRIGMMYRLLEKMDAEDLAKTLAQAEMYKRQADDL